MASYRAETVSADWSHPKLLKAIEAIYDAAPDPAGWPAALQAVADVFRDKGSILIWPGEDGSFRTIATESLSEAQREYQLAWARRDIGAVRAIERGYLFNGEVCTSRQLVSEEEEESDPFFLDFRARHGLGAFGGVAVSPDPKIGMLFRIQGHASRVGYSDAEIEMLDYVGRHIQRALRLTIRLLDAELVKVGAGDALARIGIGVFVLDGLGHVLFSNPAGQQLLGRQLQISQERLRVGSGSVRDEFDRLFERALKRDQQAQANDLPPLLVKSKGEGGRLAIYVIPIAQADALEERFLDRPRGIVLVIEQKDDEPADPAVVREVLGLTLGEARIAALVGAGLAPKDAAERLGITQGTARTVLKRVFSKVGVSRQSELVAILTKLVLR